MTLSDGYRSVSIEPFTFASRGQVRIMTYAADGCGLQYVVLTDEEMLKVCNYWMDRHAFQAATRSLSDHQIDPQTQGQGGITQ